MSNWIGYQVDALSGSPDEIGQITERLSQFPEFKTVKNLGYAHPDVNKARRFSLEFKDRYYGIIDSRLREVSQAFPATVFLLEYFDMQASYSGKRVIRAGEVVQEVFDRDQYAQGQDWVLLDIFAPFRAEHDGGIEFGSLWLPWVDAMKAAVNGLK